MDGEPILSRGLHFSCRPTTAHARRVALLVTVFFALASCNRGSGSSTRVSGRVTHLGTDPCPNLSFSIGGVHVDTDAATVFELPCRRITVGTGVSVVGSLRDAGTVIQAVAAARVAASADLAEPALAPTQLPQSAPLRPPPAGVAMERPVTHDVVKAERRWTPIAMALAALVVVLGGVAAGRIRSRRRHRREEEEITQSILAIVRASPPEAQAVLRGELDWPLRCMAPSSRKAIADEQARAGAAGRGKTTGPLTSERIHALCRLVKDGGAEGREAAFYALTTGDVRLPQERFVRELLSGGTTNVGHAESHCLAAKALGWSPSGSREMAMVSILEHRYSSWASDHATPASGFEPLRLFVERTTAGASVIRGSNRALFRQVTVAADADLILRSELRAGTYAGAYTDGSTARAQSCSISCRDGSGNVLATREVSPKAPPDKIYRPLNGPGSKAADVNVGPNPQEIDEAIGQVLVQAWKAMMYRRWRDAH